MNLMAAMVCIAGLLNLPVPDRPPEIHHQENTRGYIIFAWGGDIFVDMTGNPHLNDHIAHELSHWVTYQAEIVQGIPREWDENKARFVSNKFQTWCGQ